MGFPDDRFDQDDQRGDQRASEGPEDVPNSAGPPFGQQPGRPGYPGQPGQPGYPGRPGYPGQLGYPGQSTYPGQSGDQGDPQSYGGQSGAGYPAQPGTGYPAQPGTGYPGGDYPGGGAPGSGYPGGGYPGGGYQGGGYQGGGYQGGGYQGGGYQGGGYQGGGFPGGPAVGKVNGLSIAALVCGLAQFLLWFFLLVPGFLAALAAVILGLVGLGQIRRRGESGRGMALAGIVLGGLGVLAGVALAILIGIGSTRYHYNHTNY